MTVGPSQQQLLDRFAVQLGKDQAASIVNALMELATRKDAVDGVVVLLDELTEQAPKAAGRAIDALVEMQRRGVLAEVLPWLDLGVTIAADSGALALRFFKESP